MDTEPSQDDSEGHHQLEARARRRSALSILGIIAFILAVTTTLALLSRETGRRNSDTSQPEATTSGEETVRGSACPDLREAAASLAAEDQEGFAAAIARARREAEDSLQRDGVVFGKPERLALELASLIARDEGAPGARVRTLISKSINRCPPESDA